MEAQALDQLAERVGLAHLRAFALAADLEPPRRCPRVRTTRPGVPPETRAQRDRSAEYYVYLLVSEQHPVFKLGHTRCLRSRVNSIRGTHGDFLETDSYVVKVGSKAVALWVEGELKRSFDSLEYRTGAPRPQPLRGSTLVGGLSEWYHLRVFTSMQAFLLSLVQRNLDSQHPQYDPDHPFEPPGGMSLAGALRQAAAPSPTTQPSPGLQEAVRLRAHEEAAAWLEYSEENFRAVQSWVRCRWPWLVSLSPAVLRPGDTSRRTLCFSLMSKCSEPPEECTNPYLTDPPMRWHDLCASASLRQGDYMERRYFELVPTSASGGTLAVTFVLGGFAALGPPCFEPATDLPQRIRRWLIELGSPA